MDGALFRPGVCAVVHHRDEVSRLLMCHRIGLPPESGWQFPQGGIDPDRPLEQELRRELHEEIGTDNVEIRAVAAGLYCYVYPPHIRKKKGTRYVGQCHRWVYARLLVSEKALRFSHQPAEFDNYRWANVSEVLAHITPFKREVYSAALTALGILPGGGTSRDGVVSKRGNP